MVDNNEVHKFYENLINELNPITRDDYIKVLSLGNGTGVWNNNQDALFGSRIISLKDIISNRDDLYE